MSDSLLLEDERRIEEREQIAERWVSVNWAPEPMTKAGLKNVLMAALRELDSKRFIADESTPLDEFVEHYTTLIPQGVQPRPYKVVAVKDAERACADYSALLLSRLKAEREKNQWIPVSERLPDDSRLVNVLLCNTVVSTGHYNHGKSLWRPWAQFKGELDGVTHWMPLPEPPAARENHVTESH